MNATQPMKTKPTREDLCRPVSFDEAAKVLREWYPRYAYDRHELRRMAIARVIPCDRMDRAGMVRRYTYKVRVWDLLKAFANMASTVIESDGSVVSTHGATMKMPKAGAID